MTDEPTSQHAAIDAKVRETLDLLAPEAEFNDAEGDAWGYIGWALVVIASIFAALAGWNLYQVK